MMRELIKQIDEEIYRLQKAKAVLTGTTIQEIMGSVSSNGNGEEKETGKYTRRTGSLVAKTYEFLKDDFKTFEEICSGLGTESKRDKRRVHTRLYQMAHPKYARHYKLVKTKKNVNGKMVMVWKAQ